MRTARLGRWLGLILILVLAAIGCGKKNAPPPRAEEPAPANQSPSGLGKNPAVFGAFPVIDRTVAMNDLRNIGFTFGDAPPVKREEFERELQKQSNQLYTWVQEGRYVLLWKDGAMSNRLGGGKAVLAYVHDVPEKGGWVVLVDRSVQEMSAAEFKQAVKAGDPKGK